MIQASYTAAAAAAFMTKPQDRVAGVKALIERLGGTFHSIDFCLGEHDLVVMATLPDDVAAAAASLAVNGAGHVAGYKTTRLMTPEEFMAAQQKAHGVSYAAPAKG
jgi:uncharacterized protein with GYD domain